MASMNAQYTYMASMDVSHRGVSHTHMAVPEWQDQDQEAILVLTHFIGQHRNIGLQQEVTGGV